LNLTIEFYYYSKIFPFISRRVAGLSFIIFFRKVMKNKIILNNPVNPVKKGHF